MVLGPVSEVVLKQNMIHRYRWIILRNWRDGFGPNLDQSDATIRASVEPFPELVAAVWAPHPATSHRNTDHGTITGLNAPHPGVP